MSPRPAPPLGALALGILALGAAGLFFVARTPGPPLPAPLQQMLVLHRSMTGRTAPPSQALSGPSLHLRSRLDAEAVDSWLYQLGGEPATAHRFVSLPPLPRNAQDLPGPGGWLRTAELDEETALCWSGRCRGPGPLPPSEEDPCATPVPGRPNAAPEPESVTHAGWCVLGAQPVSRLKELVARIRQQGPGEARRGGS